MTANVHEVGELGKLAWLADAPFFIDRLQVADFYDAVVRPEALQKSITLSLSSLEGKEATIEAGATATMSVAKWLTTIFPFLDASVEATGTATIARKAEKEENRTVELQTITSPQRQLVQLTLHYLLNLPSRFRVVSNPSEEQWRTPAFIQALPRGLVFIDFPPETCFAPMAAELHQGEVVPMHEELAAAFVGGERNPNPRPNPGDAEGWDRYWRWFSDNYKPLKAMETVEDRVRGGKSRIEWVDYRVPLRSGDGKFLSKTLHLHLCGRGEHATGVFAYNFIERGYKYGVRIVGTLKSGPDIDVLAMFDK